MESSRYSVNGVNFDPRETIAIVMNPDIDLFKHVFSKLEFITSMGIIKKASEKFGFPIVGIRREMRNSRTTEYIARKYQQKMISLMSPSSFDEEYLRQFLDLDLKIAYTIQSEDIFSNNEVGDMIREGGYSSIMFAGFYTESDVYVSAVESLIHDYFPFVVSDATSTISERIYFEALDLLAQHLEVIDSRDIIRVWEVQP